MNRRLAFATLLVRDYDEAIDFYVGKLGFTLEQDNRLNAFKRWVVLRSAGEDAGLGLVLAKATTAEQRALIGKQGAGRVFLFMVTDDVARDFAEYRAAGVSFLREPERHDYGTVAVLEDLYGNAIDLIQPPEGEAG